MCWGAHYSQGIPQNALLLQLERNYSSSSQVTTVCSNIYAGFGDEQDQRAVHALSDLSAGDCVFMSHWNLSLEMPAFRLVALDAEGLWDESGGAHMLRISSQWRRSQRDPGVVCHQMRTWRRESCPALNQGSYSVGLCLELWEKSTTLVTHSACRLNYGRFSTTTGL